MNYHSLLDHDIIIHVLCGAFFFFFLSNVPRKSISSTQILFFFVADACNVGRSGNV